jgi:hypothetical protein
MSEFPELSIPIRYWRQFREELYNHPSFFDFLASSPVAVDLNTVLWQGEIYLANRHWRWLKDHGLVPADLEAAIAAAAATHNLADIWAIVSDLS